MISNLPYPKQILIVLILLLSITAGFAQQPVGVTQSFTPHSTTICSQNNCTATLYPQVMYYQEYGIWIPIDENVGTENCLPGYSYCVDRNLYQAHFKPATTRVISGDNSITLTTLAIGTSSFVATQPYSLQVDNNQYHQINIFPNINITYTYLPEFLKEDITLGSPPAVSPDEFLKVKYAMELSPNGILHDGDTQVKPSAFLESNPYYADRVNVLFNDKIQFVLRQPFAQDANGEAVQGLYAMYGINDTTYIEMRFPYTWFTNATYPIIIDPTVVLNASNMSWNGYLQFNATHYFRTDNPSLLKVGRFFRNFSTIINDTYRSVLEFDTSMIPRNASIQKIELTLYSTQAGTGGNNNISIHSLEKNNTQYTTENQSCLGNCNHYIDTGNGTLYTSLITNAGFNIYNLDVSIAEFTTALQTRSWFSYGITSHDGESQYVHGNQDARIAGKSYTFPNNRPVLNITYITNPANETEGRLSIEEGIHRALSDTQAISSNKQIYAVYSSGSHSFHSFDKYTDKDNQSWSFNYVTTGETFTNMLSLLRIVSIWENQTLASSQIVTQVENFITNTTY